MGKKSILVVGAGLAGLTIAYELTVKGYNVTIIEKRNHIGGNIFDYIDEHGILIHKYGAHIFHTSNKQVFDWLSQFTDWIPYKHKVVAKLPNGENVIFPPTKSYVDKVGLEYVKKTFYIPYTKKMWGLTIDEIDNSILDRVPVRDDESDLYFPKAIYQYLPSLGYTKLCENIINQGNIKVYLNTSFDKSYEKGYEHVFNSMPIDVYYDFAYGELPYRSIKFEVVNLQQKQFTEHQVINFTDDSKYTRMIEWKNFPNHGVNDKVTTLTYEVPCDYKDNDMERYYPVKDKLGVNRDTYRKYKEITNYKTTFIGRCGMYVYIDMDQAVSSSLSITQKFLLT